MAPSNLDEQLTKYLTDVHSIEQQALAQLKDAPSLAGDPDIASAFIAHERETNEHERLVTARLEARDAKPSKVKDLFGTLTGKGFTAFAASQPDTPGKLVVHAFSYEHLEEAAYDLLGKVAVRAGDDATAEVAARIEAEEREMSHRLAGCFDRAAELAIGKLDPADLSNQLGKYLADAHAIEAQAMTLLKKSPELAGADELAAAYDEHRSETEEHQRLIEERLRDRDESPSAIKDAALRLGALNWGAFFTAQPDTPAKLAGFAFAFEHLEIGAYEMLKRVAQRASDDATVAVAERILGEEHAAADKIRSLFDVALDGALELRGAGAR
jgi:ferritin-like metal-binding protein YciE